MGNQMHRAGIGAGALLALAMFGGAASAAVVVQGDASARLMRAPSNTFAENDPAPIALPNDGSTGVVPIANTFLYASGIGASNLSAAGMAAGSSAIGGSNSPTESSTFRALGFGNARYQDELTILSDTLPVGTPVVVQFSFHIAYAIAAQHSFGSGGGSNQGARADASLTVGLTSSDFASGTIDTENLSASNNRAILDTGFSLNIADGIFGVTRHADLFLNATVGATIDFSLILDTDANFSAGPLSGVNHTASASMALGVAFGASEATPIVRNGSGDYLVWSKRLGSTFPSAAEANDANAQGAMALVPGPSALFACACLVGPLSRQRRTIRACGT